MSERRSYSQNGEDVFLMEYFRRNPPAHRALLDIGANDGVTLSNSRLLIEDGWRACLVEPSPRAYSRLAERYAGLPDVLLANHAVALEPGVTTLYESGQHAPERYGENVGLLSTLKTDEVRRWDGREQPFLPVQVEARTVEQVVTELKRAALYPVTLLLIDAEGLDLSILGRFPLSAVSAVVVEFNSDRALRRSMVKVCAKAGLRLRAKNEENLIFCRCA